MSLLEKIEEKRVRKIKADRSKKTAIATIGVATGALIGSAAGILLAPKSGKETREDIKDKSIEIKDKISDNIEDTKCKVEESKLKIKEYLSKRKYETNDAEIIEVGLLESAADKAEETVKA